ncbi:MAG: 4-hydroxy-3-methylbut-2-enyl diphosphate reductase [Bacteroidales bacterium]
MKIEVDASAGFCFGVERVIEDTASRLSEGESLYGLGEMVHNQAELKRLETMGLKTIHHSDLPSMGSRKVLFRAHGEPPSSYRLAREAGVEVIDGTCPIVVRLQKRIRERYRQMDRKNEQLVIFGKSDHPETIGLLGQVDGDAVVVSGPGDLGKIEPGKKVHLFSQTTMDPEQFSEVEKALQTRMVEEHGPEGTGLFRSDCTICGQMKNRKPKLTKFAQKHDLILFVSGKNSSNGKMLFRHCIGINKNTHWISGSSEIEKEWFRGARSVGISGATSTSMGQLEQIRDEVVRILSS